MEGRPEFEARFVVARHLAGARGRQRRRGACGVGGQRLQVGFDRGVTRGELLLGMVEGLQVLPQADDMFGSIIPGQRGDDLGLGGVTAIVAMLGQRVRVGASTSVVPQDAQAGDAGDVADDER